MSATPRSFTIAYEDDHLLVIDKPAGLVVHPARGHRTGTLAQLLGAARRRRADPERAGIVHRLDRDTSGLLVVARSDEAHRRLQQALAERRIVREYLALVHGRPPARTGTIEAPIGRDPRMRTRMAVDGAHPREARTHFEIERPLGPFTLLRLRLDTGRTHQIRVHLQAIGHPVAGDPEYGSPRGRRPLRHARARRQFLHAARLSFAHPFTGEPIDVRSPLPADLQARTGAGRTAILTGSFQTFHPRGALDRGPARTATHLRRHLRVRGDRAATTSNTHKGSTLVAQAQVGIAELLEAGVHFGHQTRRWNPKMRRFIHGERGGIYIIDLLKTSALLNAGPGVRRRRSPTAAAPSCSSAPRSRPATRSATSPSPPACPTSTIAGSAGC